MSLARMCLALLALPTVASASNLNGHRRYNSPACPVHLPEVYLPAIGAPSLRFQAPVIVATTPLASLAKESSNSESPDFITAINGTETSVGPTSTKLEAGENTSPSPVGPGGGKSRQPAPIPPDELRPSAHPEDFLPYFEFPAPASMGGAGRVIVPGVPSNASAPGTQVPSSATYIQSPQ